jgi:hypothetical protein
MQDTHGNAHVAEQADLESVERGDFAREEPQLARWFRQALQDSRAAIESQGAWGDRVPASLRADADAVFDGHCELDGHAMNLQEVLRAAFAAEERDDVLLADAIHAAQDLLERLEVSTELLHAYDAL